MIEVWEPRWKDRRVLVAKYKVNKGRNIIKLTGMPKSGPAPWKGRYEMSEIAIRSYPVESNGSIPCYAVPLDKLTKLGG